MMNLMFIMTCYKRNLNVYIIDYGIVKFLAKRRYLPGMYGS